MFNLKSTCFMSASLIKKQKQTNKKCSKRAGSSRFSHMVSFRGLSKGEYLLIIRDNFCQFCTKTYVVTPRLNCLDETVQMRAQNIWFQ